MADTTDRGTMPWQTPAWSSMIWQLWQLCASPCDVCATTTSVVSSVVGSAVSNTRRPRDSSFDSLDTGHNVTGAKGASNSSSSSSSSTKDVCAPFGVTAAGGKTLVDRLAGNHSGKRYGERGHTHWQTAAQSETESAGRQLQARWHSTAEREPRLTQPPRGRWRRVLPRVGSAGFSVGAGRSCGGADCSRVRAGFDRRRCRMTPTIAAARRAAGRGEGGGAVEIFPPLVVCRAGAACAAAHSADADSRETGGQLRVYVGQVSISCGVHPTRQTRRRRRSKTPRRSPYWPGQLQTAQISVNRGKTSKHAQRQRSRRCPSRARTCIHSACVEVCHQHTVAEVYIILARLEPACCPLAALTEPSSSRPPSAARAHAREREKRAAP